MFGLSRRLGGDEEILGQGGARGDDSGGWRLDWISIRNIEKGTLDPLTALAPLWYHPGPTLVP